MKKFLLVNMIAVFFSCTNEVKEELNAVNNEATFQKNVENFMEFTQRFGKEDIEGVMDMFADSALWSPPEYNSYEWVSKDNLRDALSNYINNFDDLSFTPGINLLCFRSLVSIYGF